MRTHVPTGLAIILALVAGVLEVVNAVFVHLPNPWHQFVLFGLLVLSGVGISPLVHAAFRNALHLSVGATTAITVAVMAIGAALQTVAMDGTLRGILQGVLAVLAGLGFGAGTGPVAPAQPVA